MTDKSVDIEFWSDKGLVGDVDSYAVPRTGEYINIRGETWLVSRVTWALDYSDDPLQKRLRANVELERTNDD